MNRLPTYHQNPKKSLFTVSQAANYLGVSSKTLRRWEVKGILVALRTVGGQRRYHRQVLQNFKIKKELTRTFIREHPIGQQKNQVSKSNSRLRFNLKLFYTLFLVMILILLILNFFFKI